jgi:hypothetical protein
LALDALDKKVNLLQYHNCAENVLFTCYGNFVNIYDLNSPKNYFTLKDHEDIILSLSFNYSKIKYKTKTGIQ